MNNLTTIIVSANCTILMQTNYAYSNTAQKMKFSIKDFFSKCDQINDPVYLILFPSPSTISETHFLFVNINFFDKRSFFVSLFVLALFFQFWFFLCRLNLRFISFCYLFLVLLPFLICKIN